MWCNLKLTNNGNDRPIANYALGIGDYVGTESKKGIRYLVILQILLQSQQIIGFSRF